MEELAQDPASTEELFQIEKQAPKVSWPVVRLHAVPALAGTKNWVFGVWPDRILVGCAKNPAQLNAVGFNANSADDVAALQWKGQHIDVDPSEIEIISTTYRKSGGRGYVMFSIRTVAGILIRPSAPLEESANLLAALDAATCEDATSTPEVEDQLSRLQLSRGANAAKNFKHQRAGEPPFRSPVLGRCFRYLGAALMAAAIVVTFILNDAPDAILDFWLAGLSLFIMGHTCFTIGRRIGAPSYEEVVARDQRQPVLFLRSFDSEDVESPAPGTSRMEKLASGAFNRIPYAPWVLDSLLGSLRAIYSLQGTFAERIEEQLARVVRKLGPLTAIGEPGERIAAAGAARAYVAHDKWQDFVIDVMSRARAVLIQIEPTAGTMWEFEQCIQRIPPERLLVMLTANYGSASAYENVRSLASELLPKPLPPYLGKGGFVMFDKDWNAELLPLQFRPPFLRHLAPSIVNYRKSLAPFVARFEKQGALA